MNVKLRKVIAMLMCLSLLCGLLSMNVTSVAAADNLVVNGDFELGDTSGWDSYGDTAADPAAARSGNYGANLTGPGNWNSLMTQTIPVSGGRTYHITVWIKTVSVGVNIQIKKNNNSGGSFATEWFSNTDWTALTWTVTAEDTTKAIFLNFCGGGTGTTETVYVDDVSVVEASMIANGDFEAGNADGWTTNTTTGVAGEAAYSGNYGLHMVGAGDWNTMAKQVFEVIPGNIYEVSFRIKANKGGANIQIRDNATDEDLMDPAWYNSNAWKKVTYTVKPTGDTIYLNFCGSGTGSVDDLYLDDVSLARIAVASDDGFLRNGDFESGTPINWDVYQETTVSPDAAYTGNFGARLQGDGGWGSTLVQSFPTVVGREYKISFYLMAVEQGTNVQIKNSRSEILARDWFNNTVWIKQSLSFVATSTTSTLNFCGGGTGTTEIVYIDDVEVTEIKPLEAADIITGGQSSVRDTAFGTKALAFRFDVEAFGAKTIDTTEYVADSATVYPWDGEDATYTLQYAGAIVSIDEDLDADTMELYDVDGKKVKDVTAKYLCDVAEESFSFAIRIVDIPDSAVDTAISVRPYYVFVNEDGKTMYMYGDAVSASYNDASAA